MHGKADKAKAPRFCPSGNCVSAQLSGRMDSGSDETDGGKQNNNNNKLLLFLSHAPRYIALPAPGRHVPVFPRCRGHRSRPADGTGMGSSFPFVLIFLFTLFFVLFPLGFYLREGMLYVPPRHFLGINEACLLCLRVVWIGNLGRTDWPARGNQF